MNAREQAERLECAFEQLPDDQREVLALSRIAEVPTAEIAEHLVCSERTVRRMLSRALTALSRALDA